MTQLISTRAVATATVLGLLAAAGCASAKTHGDGDPFSQGLAERNEVQINVINSNFADATVWVMVRDARRTRLGVVIGKTDATFTIPWTFSEPMRLEFDLLADVRCKTEELTVDPGDILELQISVDPGSDPQCR